MRFLIPLAALAVLAPAAHAAEERVLQFKSVEDPAFPPDPAICARAPFKANLRLGGSLHSTTTRHSDGQITAQRDEPIGSATACAQITSFAFPAGLQQKFFAHLNLPEGVVEAAGTCTIVSNDVPQGGLVLAGCNLHVTQAPPGVLGGAVVTLSTFNPFRLSGFATGSFWTVQLYDDRVDGHDHHDSEDAMQWSGDDDAGE